MLRSKTSKLLGFFYNFGKWLCANAVVQLRDPTRVEVVLSHSGK